MDLTKLPSLRSLPRSFPTLETNKKKVGVWYQMRMRKYARNPPCSDMTERRTTNMSLPKGIITMLSSFQSVIETRFQQSCRPLCLSTRKDRQDSECSLLFLPIGTVPSALSLPCIGCCWWIACIPPGSSPVSSLSMCIHLPMTR